MSSTVVLVPGAWHLPTCFDQLRQELHALGVASVAVANPSVEDCQPPKNLTHDVAHLHAVLARLADEGKQITLVAHSYGGVVASGAAQGLGLAQRQAVAQQGGIARVLYLGAFAIPAQASLLQAVGGVAPPWWEYKGDQVVVNDPHVSNPARVFYNDLPPETQSHWISQLRPHTATSFEIPNSYEPWKDIPCTYVFTEQDNAIPLFAQKAMAGGMGDISTVSLDASHSPFLSMPKQVAKIIVDASQ
ncbi:alpha/beta hydrolase [Aspergillus affinis]|uniref:alpha/beta hydrolase n=1 Tax=Aspergillus affinis TaxID=1070780 RepID=UPI0022FF0800|nr:alpha/beta-hydrolase [Aspergillus affinis]KAI9041120.1 alpha/beta-hydrolase [Aspergillus affinis]